MSLRPYPADPQAGFTLIETLLALTIVSTIGLIIVMSFMATFGTVENLREDEQQEHEARLVLSIIANDLVASAFDVRFPWTGLNRTVDGRASDVIAILTRSPSRADRTDRVSDAVRVVYSREGSRLIRWAMTNVYSASKQTLVQSEVARNVLSFNLRYYNLLLKTWTDSWDSSSVSKSPFAVLISLTMNHPGKDPRTYTQWVTIPTQGYEHSSKI